jgi:hypothetical protein
MELGKVEYVRRRYGTLLYTANINRDLEVRKRVLNHITLRPASGRDLEFLRSGRCTVLRVFQWKGFTFANVAMLQCQCAVSGNAGSRYLV